MRRHIIHQEMTMCLSISLSDHLEAALRKQAKEEGVSPEVLAARLVEHSVRRLEETNAALAPIREAFLASGMTEDEAVELFEQEKHAMRKERREKGA